MPLYWRLQEKAETRRGADPGGRRREPACRRECFVGVSRAARVPSQRATEAYACAACVVCPVEIPAGAFLSGRTPSWGS
ncbi:MAG: hypothetical protein QOE87_1800 [Gaiellales bacterium]|nr:hypothetical protein [Gaiellales bacterium]